MSIYWPTGLTTVPHISDGYGPRKPINGSRPFHFGTDIPTKPGQLMLAAADGQVVFSGRNGSLGEQVVIDTAFGQFLYPHNKPGTLLPLWSKVKALQPLAETGLSGNTTGYHTCFRVFEGSWQRDADARNPEQFFARINGTATAASDIHLAIFRQEGEENMQYVAHDESKGVFGIDWEKIVHFTTMRAAQINANIFTAEDKIKPVTTQEFQDLLRGNAIAFSHPDRLINEDPGGSWSRDQVNTLLLEDIKRKLGA